MQATQTQYNEEPHNSHQDYGGYGYHTGHTKYRGRGGRGAQRKGDWRGGRGGRGNSDLTPYCWTHEICAHPRKYCRNSEELHKKDSVWCTNISGSEHNCTCQLGSIPAINPNSVETKTYYISKLLCSSILDPPQHLTINEKYDTGMSNNYWRT